ncbi:hypothetical protein [Sulfitobacter sediminilitoris]|uniref:hypothetical protein n=1 Tax=Sulfitobacter sediminilitoris TaxID=2698830 RepID=UPI0036DB75DC
MTDFLILRRIAGLGLTTAGLFALIMAARVGLWPAVTIFAVLAFSIAVALLVYDRLGGVAFAIASLLLGPFAGPVLLLAATGSAISPTKINNAPEVAELTKAERISSEIAEGRRPLTRASSVPALAHVFASGTLIDQQTALAAVARQYTPELHSVLERALASDIPAVRVQAAAILAHLRDSFSRRARALIADETGLSGTEHETEITTVSTSGFIDAATTAEIERRWRPTL